MKLIKTLSLILVASTLIPASVHAWSWSDVVKPALALGGFFVGKELFLRNFDSLINTERQRRIAESDLIQNELALNQQLESPFAQPLTTVFDEKKEEFASLEPKKMKHLGYGLSSGLVGAACSWYLINSVINHLSN